MHAICSVVATRHLAPVLLGGEEIVAGGVVVGRARKRKQLLGQLGACRTQQRKRRLLLAAAARAAHARHYSDGAEGGGCCLDPALQQGRRRRELAAPGVRGARGGVCCAAYARDVASEHRPTPEPAQVGQPALACWTRRGSTVSTAWAVRADSETSDRRVVPAQRRDACSSRRTNARSGGRTAAGGGVGAPSPRRRQATKQRCGASSLDGPGLHERLDDEAEKKQTCRSDAGCRMGQGWAYAAYASKSL